MKKKDSKNVSNKRKQIQSDFLRKRSHKESRKCDNTDGKIS